MIEEKLDGERIQLHKKGDIFQYWSRCVHRAVIGHAKLSAY